MISAKFVQPLSNSGKDPVVSCERSFNKILKRLPSTPKLTDYVKSQMKGK